MESRDVDLVREENKQLVETVIRLETLVLEEQRKAKRQDKVFKLLRMLHQDISQVRDVPTICQLTVKFLAEKMGFDRTLIFQQTPEAMHPIACWGYRNPVSSYGNDSPMFTWAELSQPLLVNGTTSANAALSSAMETLLEMKYFLALPLGLPQGQNRYLLMLGNQTEGTFKRPTLTPFDLEIFQTLTQQIAIAIYQIELYSELEGAKLSAESQSNQLQLLLQDLQNTQSQVVQAEKMAALGNLVAGVAHEINNPVGFLKGSIHNATDYVEDLLAHLQLCHQHHEKASTLPTSIHQHAEKIDLEFLSEDLPKLLTSMQKATDRITGISTSLRTFSRADTEHKVDANLHDGIDSTILILKYRLKANEHRPAIEVTQDYQALPLVSCYPGQLNQVFMNILANAIDALEESSDGRTYEQIQNNPHRITIATEIEKEQVKITIADNGKGMPQDVKDKIFDHLFTTKGVGKGTGLGLAIAHQIVVEKHGGAIVVDSAPGQGTEFVISLPI
jgi:signal transduction histidine kinase